MIDLFMIKEKTSDSNQLEIWSKDLTKVYGKGIKTVKAVDGIDIYMEPGVHGFLGPNGAGKTSTINMLIGAISITKGKAKIKGNKAGSVKSRKIIGFLPQDPAFYERMTGKDYLHFIARMSSVSKKNAILKTEELLNKFNLKDAEDRFIENYSGGMKQKIALAAAFIGNPKILILDEPTSDLDPIGRNTIISDIKTLSEKISILSQAIFYQK